MNRGRDVAELESYSEGRHSLIAGRGIAVPKIRNFIVSSMASGDPVMPVKQLSSLDIPTADFMGC